MKKRPDLILTADWHIRHTHPRCRTDNFVEESQWSAVDQVTELQKECDCPVVVAGDLFHKAHSPNWLITQCIYHFPDHLYAIYGDHDPPNKRMEAIEKSNIETIRQAGAVHVLENTHWGKEIEDVSFDPEGLEDRKVAVTHRFVWDGENWPWPDCNEMTARQMLEAYPEYDLIVTGDYHKGFVYEMDGRLLVNPGCLTRQVADYKDYRPRVYLWYADTNKIRPWYLKTNTESVSWEHIEQQEKRQGRLTAFVERLDDKWESTVSLEDNFKRFFDQNKIRESIVSIIDKSLEK